MWKEAVPGPYVRASHRERSRGRGQLVAVAAVDGVPLQHGKMGAHVWRHPHRQQLRHQRRSLHRPRVSRYAMLTLSMLRLLSSKAQDRKDLKKHLNPASYYCLSSNPGLDM